jgi:hypothetical protein
MNPASEAAAAETLTPGDATEPDAAQALPAEDGPARPETHAMASVRAIDPAFRSFADLSAMPEAEAFNRLVLKGNTLADAFRLARYDALGARQAAEAGRNALSRAYNRAHLSATGGGGTQADLVPPETLEMYRQICPGLPDEAYRAHYRQVQGKT